MPQFVFAAENVETVRISTGPLLPYIGEDLPNYGTAAHIVTEAFAKEGVKVEYVFLPWRRAFVEAKEGSFDGTILWRKTPKREEDFYFSDPVIKIDIVFFHLKGFEFNWNSVEDLKKQKIRVGYVQGLEYEDEFNKGLRSGQIVGDMVTSLEQNLRKLLLERISITPTAKESGYAMIREIFSPEEVALFTHNPLTLATHSLHLIMSKKNKNSTRMLELFNQGLGKLNASKN